ncbi:helix-turn-helix domain-containing protein [Saccharopolyspora phatthalungensis]|uniref:Transcriptional regulator with XRE-family HTH domain n=1 Tax=Saccharopolyspora phatthalungensis TaxID=664693 RepID=A0A840QHT9_9PSEU|nr:helix-turn-helix transcriptional regulator [Saccharopolyspora phatthalungensis]MBB5158125.1 transcriptional regulator with XRE-family HTH domain [Saccharopolyspora phatthalungensis]
MSGDAMSLGERIKRIRMRRQLTREKFAEKADVSVDLVRKLEQGVRHTASMSSLTRMATALDVEVAQLLGQSSTVEPTVDTEATGVLAIRDALTSLAYFPGLGSSEIVADEPPTVAHLRSALAHCERIRKQGSFAQLGAILPGLIAEAHGATRELTGDDQAAAFGVLSEVFQVASTMMAALGQTNIGYIGLIRAQEAAQRAGDDLLQAMNVSSLSWVLFKQGRLKDAEEAAVRKAEQLRPDFIHDGARKLGVWGVLMLRAASAAVRNKKPDRAEEYLSLARTAAARIGSDQTICSTPFGPTNVGIASVNAAVESERFENALTLARSVSLPGNDSLSPTWKARYLLDLTIAYSGLDRDHEATAQLLKAERLAPEWMRYHTLTRQTVYELAERAKRRRTPIQELADRLDILD